jgi:hypothetical protein
VRPGRPDGDPSRAAAADGGASERAAAPCCGADSDATRCSGSGRRSDSGPSPSAESDAGTDPEVCWASVLRVRNGPCRSTRGADEPDAPAPTYEPAARTGSAAGTGSAPGPRWLRRCTSSINSPAVFTTPPHRTVRRNETAPAAPKSTVSCPRHAAARPRASHASREPRPRRVNRRPIGPTFKAHQSHRPSPRPPPGTTTGTPPLRAPHAPHARDAHGDHRLSSHQGPLNASTVTIVTFTPITAWCDQRPAVRRPPHESHGAHTRRGTVALDLRHRRSPIGRIQPNAAATRCAGSRSSRRAAR